MANSTDLLDLRALETFIAVCDTGGMGVAARRIGLTQPAVSQIVRRLEADLGVQLFDRQSGRIRLARAGEILEQRGRALLADARQLAMVLRQSESAKLRNVRVGLVNSFAATAGPRLINSLAQFADLISVSSGLSAVLANDFHAGALDIVVISDPLEDTDDLERHRILTETFSLVLPASLELDGGEVNLETLSRKLPLIRYSERSFIGLEIERHLRRLRIRAPKSLEFDATEAVFAMVAAGVGWSLIPPLCLLQGRTFIQGLRVLPLPKPRLNRSLYLIVREKGFRSVAAVCADAARDALSDLRDELEGFCPWLRSHFDTRKQEHPW